jgi:hypothetical protein
MYSRKKMWEYLASYSVKYRAETKGLVSIPETEIRLSNNIYTQNPGW